MPDREKFFGSATSTPQEAYYSTLLRELGHWTGAEHRLNREKGKRFADRVYCFEEVIAELTASFMCAQLSITDTPRADHAQYIAGYLAMMKEDRKAIFAAAAAASAAVDHIMAYSTTR